MRWQAVGIEDRNAVNDTTKEDLYTMKRKGFTLVELLIVIAIMGALAATMTLSSTNATASAEAAKIVNGLRAVRTATTMFYWDHPDFQKVEPDDWADDVEDKFTDEIASYLDTGMGGQASDYVLKLVGATAKVASEANWYVGYKIPDTGVSVTVLKRLAGQADTYGLKGGTSTTDEGKTTITFDDTKKYEYKTTGAYNIIFMLAHAAAN